MGLWLDIGGAVFVSFRAVLSSGDGRQAAGRGWCSLACPSSWGHGRRATTGHVAADQRTARWRRHHSFGLGDDKPKSPVLTHHRLLDVFLRIQHMLSLYRPRLPWHHQEGPVWWGTTCGDACPGPAAASLMPTSRPRSALSTLEWWPWGGHPSSRWCLLLPFEGRWPPPAAG